MSKNIEKDNQANIQPTKRWIKITGVGLITSMLSACSFIGVDYSVCDLKVLSLLIPKQTEEAVTSGRLMSINELENSQKQMNQALNAVHDQYASRDGVDVILKDGQVINRNINLILQNRSILGNFYDFKISITEVIPSIQAEYNLMVDVMSRDNIPSTQVIIGKNQIFLAERILRSINGFTNEDAMAINNIDDFLADMETFNAYLNAQLDGNAELGVQRVQKAEFRESLLSIQQDLNEIQQSEGFSLIKKREPLSLLLNTVNENKLKSDEIYKYISKLD